MVNVTVRVLSKPNPEKLVKIFRTMGTDYDERVMPGIVNEVLKSVVVRDFCNIRSLSRSLLLFFTFTLTFSFFLWHCLNNHSILELEREVSNECVL
jgi:hypothetical protein